MRYHAKKEYITNLRFDESSNFLTGEYEERWIGCFIQANKPKVVVDLTGEYEDRWIGCFIRANKPKVVVDEEPEDEVYDLAEVIYAGIKALENCK